MESYAALGNEELWNSARLRAYLEAGYGPPGVQVNSCSDCAGLPEALACEDADGNTVPPVYTYPADPVNPAPWYDPADPSSADFAGLLILEVDGWEVAPLNRPVQRKIGGGGVLGRATYGPRVIDVTALLIGRTCCSLMAGLKWLTSVTRAACADCGGEDLTYFECCPGIAGDCNNSDQNGTPEDFARHQRTLRGAGITTGVDVVERVGRGCGRCRSGCAYMQVTFQLTASDPFSYGALRCYAEDQDFVDEDSDECITWVKDEDCDDDPCGSPLCPVQDPSCPLPPTPPGLPMPIGCGCDPLTSAGSCATIPAEDVPDWQELVPIITIFSGSMPLRSIKVRFYQNPLNRPVEELDDCDVCAEFRVSYLQEGATFVMDGRDRRFRVSCTGGQENNGGRLVSGREGRIFEWPVLDCGGGYTVCITADATTIAPDATFDVCAVPRSAA